MKDEDTQPFGRHYHKNQAYYCRLDFLRVIHTLGLTPENAQVNALVWAWTLYYQAPSSSY